jgi:DNA-binding SARP family transcriptional activator
VLLAARRRTEHVSVQASGRHDTDPWGAAAASLIEGALRLCDGLPAAETLEEAALRFRRLGAGVLETWARAGLALALAAEGRPEARQAAVAADRCARSVGVPSAETLALLALGLSQGAGGAEHLMLARSLAEQHGLCFPPLPLDLRDGEPGGATPDGEAGRATRAGEAGEATRNGERSSPVASNGRKRGHLRGVAPPVSLSCFGGFRLQLDGRTIDGGGLKPRPRAALHLLAIHAGRPVHRETLVEALWPEVDVTAGMRNLHVAVSTIRRFLEPEVGRGAPSIVVREGDAYRLALSDDAVVDIREFEAGLGEGRAARAAGATETAIAGYERALEAYTGELLPEAGPAEWVVMPRERYRVEASEAALALTELHVERGDLGSAVAVGEQGLRIDRFRDAQWRILITACELAGDAAGALRVRRSYDEMLADLGLAPTSLSAAGLQS